MNNYISDNIKKNNYNKVPIYSNKFPDKKIQNLIKDLNLKGYCNLPNFLKPKSIDFFLNKINSQYSLINSKKKIQYQGVPKRDTKDKIIYNLFNKDISFLDLLVDSTIKKICKTKLNDIYYRMLPLDKPNYTLQYYNARSSGSKLDLHIDSFIPYVGEYTNMIQVSILLEDSNISNGCTVVVPKSHQSGKYTNRKTKNIKCLEGKAGDLLIWDSRLWHGTLKNTSNQSRWAIIATFGQWWIKPSVDIVRSLDKKIFNKLNNEQKQILGFCSIPPINEFDNINTKSGYGSLKKNLKNYNF